MRITSKGQLTIPKDIRERAGLMPGADVEVVCEAGVVTIRRSQKKRPDAIEKRLDAFTGTGNRKYSTEELMALMRGED